ncbi:hypothetical protein C8R45DRAFT_1021360 [Mycena sanguinolenta]|nr:hypothetical protein C8R45DRAFT_1021360 [Mycena sanguinolenta]
MNVGPFSAHDRRAAVLEQTKRTKNSSKADIERLVEESKLKIISLDSQISPLVQLRDRERASLAALTYLLSPIHTLPVELLADIFDLAIDDWTHIRDALRMSQVCSEWRQIAHSIPRLWARPIRVDLESRSDSKAQAYIEGLKEWLARSAPLSVPVSFVLERGEVDDCILEEALGTASRWRSLDLRLRKEPPLSLVRRLAQCRLSRLEELDLGTSQLEKDIDEELTAISFPTLSRLQKLRIGIFSDGLSIIMPWAQLTDLTLFCDSPDITLDTLAQCPNLTRASARTTGWFTLPDARAVIAFNRLRTLSLPFWGWAGPYSHFFDYLSAPLLEELSLNFSDLMDHKEWSEAHFTAFQLRSPNITRLEFSYIYFTLDGFRAIIGSAPSLTHLELNYCHQCFDDALIGALTYRKGTAGTLTPRLHHLVTEDVLAEMIASRWWTDDAKPVSPAVARWSFVEVVGEFSQRFVDNMEVLRRKGLCVQGP